MKYFKTITELFVPIDNETNMNIDLDNYYLGFGSKYITKSDIKDIDKDLKRFKKTLFKSLIKIDIDNITYIIKNILTINYILDYNGLDKTKIFSIQEIMNSEPFPIKKGNDLYKILTFDYIHNTNQKEIIEFITKETESLFKKDIDTDNIKDQVLKRLTNNNDYELDFDIDSITDNDKLLSILLILTIIDKIFKIVDKTKDKDITIYKKSIKDIVPITTTASATIVNTSINKMEYKQKLSDPKLESAISNLHPKVQDRFRYFLSEIIKSGYKIIITSHYRDFSKQSNLKMEREDNARPGYSMHNYGMAIDINIINTETNIQYKKSTTMSKWISTGIPDLAKSLGFRWGGDFKSYYDPIHFDLGNDYDIDILRSNAIIASGQTDNTDLDWSKIKGNSISI